MLSRGPEGADKEEFVSSLARGLAVIRAFNPDRRRLPGLDQHRSARAALPAGVANGISGIAAPVFDGTAVVGPVSCMGPGREVTEEEFIAARLPELRTAVRHISEELTRSPAFAQYGAIRW